MTDQDWNKLVSSEERAKGCETMRRGRSGRDSEREVTDENTYEYEGDDISVDTPVLRSPDTG